MSRLLVVDDEHSICWGLTRLGESLGHEVMAASSAEQALDQVTRRVPDVVVLDVRLPGMDGLSAIERFQQQLGSVPIIVITAYGDLKTAVEAVRRGAFDYIAKPFDVEKVKLALVRALASQQHQSPRQPNESPTRIAESIEGMIGSSAAMQDIYKQIALAASSDAAVLLWGESGTGKELAARAIHRYSRRAAGPFIAVSVAALDPSSADRELFGLEITANEASAANHLGLVAQANGGTLFLDEVADLPFAVQVRLLRSLEQNEIVPSGGSRPIQIDCRVLSATRQNLLQRAAEGKFRHELLYRLGAFQIDLPPLCDRADDITDLANYFLSLLSDVSTRRNLHFAHETIEELQRRPWPGNVRELRNAIEHARIVTRGRAILPEHLPPIVARPPGSPRAGADEPVIGAVRQWTERHIGDPALSGRVYEELLDVIERPLLEVALNRHRGQCASAARTLGIHRTTLRKKLDQHRLEDSVEAEPSDNDVRPTF